MSDIWEVRIGSTKQGANGREREWSVRYAWPKFVAELFLGTKREKCVRLERGFCLSLSDYSAIFVSFM